VAFLKPLIMPVDVSLNDTMGKGRRSRASSLKSG
jgi:hypothetical protein